VTILDRQTSIPRKNPRAPPTRAHPSSVFDHASTLPHRDG
jgi:hypothetical protein